MRFLDQARSAFWRGLLFVITAAIHLYAQHPADVLPYTISVKHITVEQGLPSRSVTTVGQDKQGFIWIGTLDNAFRYDGKRFMALPSLASPPKLQAYSPTIEMIRTDRRGNLWLASNIVAGHRNQYVLKAGQTQPQWLESTLNRVNPFQNDPIYDHIRSATGSFHYVRTRSGRIWWHQPLGTFRKLFQHAGLTGADAFKSTAFETQQHTLLLTVPIATSRSALAGEQQPNELIELDSLGHVLRRQLLPIPARPVWKDADGTVYLYRILPSPAAGTQAANPLATFLYRLQSNGVLIPLPVSLNRNPFFDPAHYAFQDLKSYYDPVHKLFWICGHHLLLGWHPQRGVVFDLSTTDFPTASIQICHQILVDQTGVVWVSTTNGVLLLTLEPKRFQRYLYVADPRSSANWESIRGILSVNNQLWVNSRETQRTNLTTGRSQFVFQGLANQNLSTSMCALSWGDDGMIWAGAAGLVRVDPKTLQPTLVAAQPDNPVVSAWADGRHHLWLGHQNGLSFVDTKRIQPQVFRHYNQFSELARSRINGFFHDKQLGGIWVAATSGLYRLDPLRGITERYSTYNQTLPFDHITALLPDADEAGVYWLATRGGGLIRWNRTSATYEQFTTNQGLSDNTLYALYEDKYKRLWLPSNYGLMSFHRKSHKVQVYHTKDGIANEEFNLIAHHRAADGRLFLGGLNGITAFYPDQLLAEKQRLSPLLVTQLLKLNPETGRMNSVFGAFSQEKQIHLTPGDRLFSVQISLLDYRYIGQNRLWYRLAGYQDQWVRHESFDLQVNGLPPGHYALEARAQSINGYWASPVLRIPIVVDKPIYLRTWFLLLALVLLIALILAIFRWRNRQLVLDKIQLEVEVARRTAQIEQDKIIIEQDKATIEQQANDLRANATLKSRFFANVTHEFRTPLALLIGPIQYLLKRPAHADAHPLLSTMERNTQHLLNLVNDLLDLSRLDARKLTLLEEPANLAQVVDQVVEGFMPSARYEGITLHLVGTELPLPLLLDRPKAETVLRNLIANALHYTYKGGCITVSLSSTDTLASLKVSDTGSGIHADDLPYIFDRYFQSNRTDKPLRGGTGIGLALCREYCTLWGGTLAVVSQPGQGSTFTVTYPIRPVEQASLPVLTTALINPRAMAMETALIASPNDFSNEPTILLVDDHQDMMQYLKLILRPFYRIQTAQNGQEALRLLEVLPADQLPNLIISDIMMPEVDGLELIQKLKETPALRSIPIILLTARVDLDSRLRALQFGIADYMTKPFHEAELLARVRNLLVRVDEQTNWQQEFAENPDLAGKLTPDASWIQLVQEQIRQHLTSSDLNVKTLADLLLMSERQLYRRCKSATGLSPNQFIHEIRLQIAHELLEQRPNALVKTIALEVGYRKLSYFSQLYRERFGVSPGEQQSQWVEQTRVSS